MSDDDNWGAGYDADANYSDDRLETEESPAQREVDAGGSRLLAYIDRLEDHRDRLIALVTKISAHHEVSPKSWPSDCLDAAACSLAAMHYPPVDPDEPRFQAFRRKAADATAPMGDRVNRHLKREMSAIIAAIRGLEAMDAIGDPPPPSWDNLAPGPMAREINARSLSTFRGRIVGWEGA